MEDKKEILLPSKRFKKADEQELNINLGLESSQTLLRIGDKDVVLDIDKLYDKERNESKKYKIYGKLKMVFRNMYSGDTSYNYLQERLYLNGKGDGVGNPTLAGFLPYDESLSAPSTSSYLTAPSISSSSVPSTSSYSLSSLSAPSVSSSV